MAAPVDTNTTGEGDEGDLQSIEKWMKKNSFNLAPDTFKKLEDNGFTTIAQLKLMQSSEIVDAAKEMKIKLADRFALKRARDALGEKKNFVDPEELSIINSINSKIKTFENELNDMNGKQENINNGKDTITQEICAAFDTLTKALNDRKQQLLQRVNHIIDRNNEKIKQKQDDMNQSLNAMKKYQNDTDTLMDSAIALHELKERKLKIKQNEQEIVKIIKQNKQRNWTVIDERVYFVFNAKNALNFVKSLGSVVDITAPVLVSLEYDNNNPNGVIAIGWKFQDICDNKDDMNEKIRIEYSLKDEQKENDDNKQQWESKEIVIDNNANEGIESVDVDTIGVYVFKIKAFKKASWSQYSNMKSIKIDNIFINPFDSRILKENEGKILTNWMNEKVINNDKNKTIKYNLLWRITRDGKTTASFHNACDNKGATLTIFHSEYDHVFGGYTTLPWSNTGKCKKDDHSFIYLLRSQFGHNPQIYTNTQPENAVYHNSSYGPSFGSGCDVGFNITNDRDMYFYPESVYKYKGNSICGGTSYDASKKWYTCKLKECEVYQVIV